MNLNQAIREADMFTARTGISGYVIHIPEVGYEYVTRHYLERYGVRFRIFRWYVFIRNIWLAKLLKLIKYQNNPEAILKVEARKDGTIFFSDNAELSRKIQELREQSRQKDIKGS